MEVDHDNAGVRPSPHYIRYMLPYKDSSFMFVDLNFGSLKLRAFRWCNGGVKQGV